MTRQQTMSEMAERKREYLLLASYCGTDNATCTEARPCSDCLAMCNVFDDSGNFLRELGEPRASGANPND